MEAEDSVLSILNTSLVNPDQECMRKGRQIDKGMFILNTLASLESEFDIPNSNICPQVSW